MITACMSRSWKVLVSKKKKNTRRDDQPKIASIRSTSSTKQHKLVCQLRTNTRPLALDQQTTTATESGTTASTKHAILLPTYHHLRAAQLNNRRNLYNTTLEAPGTHSQCCCVAFPGAAVIVITTTSSSFSQACASSTVSLSVFFCHLFIQINKANKAHNTVVI